MPLAVCPKAAQAEARHLEEDSRQRHDEKCYKREASPAKENLRNS